MSNNANKISEHEAIEAMLPWYESGQLDAADEERVRVYLAAHPDMASQLALVEEERVESVRMNEARGAPGAGALDRLMGAIEEHEAATPFLTGAKTALWGWASKLLGAPVPASLRWVGAAAAVLIIVQGISLGMLLTSGTQPGGGFETASGPHHNAAGQSVKGSFAFVQFADGANASDITQLLTEFEITIIDGPGAQGAYKIRLSENTLDEAARDALLDTLQARKNVISFAAPVE